MIHFHVGDPMRGLKRWVVQPSNLLIISTGLSGGASIVVTKVVAVIFGAAGVGIQGVVTGYASAVAIFAGLGLATALPAVAGKHESDLLGSIVRTALLLGLSTASVVGFVSGAFAPSVTGLALPARSVGLGCGVTVVVLVMQALLASRLSVLQLVRRLALFQGATAVASAAVSVCLVAVAPREALPLSIAGGYVSGLIIGYLVAGRPSRSAPPVRTMVDKSGLVGARELLRFGWPVVASSVFSTGALAVQPLLISHLGGIATAGFYRAAAGLSIIVGTVVMAPLGARLYPRLSAATSQAMPGILSEDVVPTLRIAVAVLGAITATAPWLLEAVYSQSFVISAPALGALAWGAFIRLIGVSNSYVLLARGRTGLYFLSEASAAFILVAGLFPAAFLSSVTAYAVVVAVAFAGHLVLTESVLRLARLPSALSVRRVLVLGAGGATVLFFAAGFEILSLPWLITLPVMAVSVSALLWTQRTFWSGN